MADCPCNENKIKVVHSKGIYIKQYKKSCDDCKDKSKSTQKSYSTKNIRSRRFK